jgi:hypothetical protein
VRAELSATTNTGASLVAIDQNVLARATASSRSSRPLPLPSLPVRAKVALNAEYAVVAVDAHGRISGLALMRRLGWHPGSAICFSPLPNGVGFVVKEGPGGDTVTRQGHLRVPVGLRRLFRLRAGSRMLVCARTDLGTLLAYTMHTVELMTAWLADVIGLEPAP